MKTIGIIAEYNPFHNGHQYQIQEAKRQTGADFVIAVISGDFVQRGEPALYDKHSRATMALHSGVDLVLELPCAFATSSAEDFASCGVALLDKLGVVDFLYFGSECGEIQTLSTTATILLEEPEDYRQKLKEMLRKGYSYPKARQEALLETQFSMSDGTKVDALATPNNILGVEYIKALKRRNSTMIPCTIQRQGQGYHDTLIPHSQDFASASAIRSAIASGNTKELHLQMPMPPQKNTCTLFPDDSSGLLNYRLLSLHQENYDLTQFLDVSSELAHRISSSTLEFASFTQRIHHLKTKQYTYTRISRTLLHILLGITKNQISSYKSQDYVNYARVLGFQTSASPLLRRIKEVGQIPLITKTADANRQLDDLSMTQLEQDFYCSHIYQCMVQEKSGILPFNEFISPIVIL